MAVEIDKNSGLIYPLNMVIVHRCVSVCQRVNSIYFKKDNHSHYNDIQSVRK